MKRHNTFMILAVLCLHFHFTNAQQSEIDSLKNILQHTEQFQQIKIDYQLASVYEESSQDSALAYYNKGLSLSKSLGIDTLMAIGYSKIGFIKTNTGEYNEAITYLFKALEIYEKNKMDKKAIPCLQYIGIAYTQQGIFDKAMDYTKKALALSQASHDLYSASVSLTSIGSIYYAQSDLEQALGYFQNALEVMEELKDKQGIADALNNVAVIYEEQENFTKALEYHMRSLTLAEELNDKRGISASYHNIALVYKSLEKYPTAITYLDSCISIAREAGDKFYLKESYNSLSEIYAFMGKYDSAYQNKLIFEQYKDSLLNEDSKRQFAEMSTKYESEKKEQQISLLNKDKKIQQSEIDKQKLLRNAFVGGFIIVLLFAGIFFAQRNKINKGKKRSDELLLNILPSEVAEELKTKGTADAKQFNEVTVMFTDFKDFTQISEHLTPAELVAEIHTFYKAFDNIIDKHNIEKIKTIGDSYMCVGGLPISNTTHAVDVIKAAIEMLEFIKQHAIERRNENKVSYEIRIGIHTGPVVAGIVGVKKFAYDIWGDAVNIASRMESSGEPGKINISGSTYEIVKNDFNCVYRGKIQAKHKGEIDMYFVEP